MSLRKLADKVGLTEDPLAERRAKIMEKAAKANIPAKKRISERIDGIFAEGNVPEEVYKMFIALPADVRAKKLALLEELQDNHTKLHDHHLAIAEEANKRKSESDRKVDFYLTEADTAKKEAEAARKQASIHQKTININRPRIFGLMSIDSHLKDGGDDVKDLPGIPDWKGVQEAVGISEKDDVHAIKMQEDAKEVLKSFKIRGLVLHKDHCGEELVMSWSKYEDTKAYQNAIARHMGIDMSDSVEAEIGWMLNGAGAGAKRPAEHHGDDEDTPPPGKKIKREDQALNDE